MVECCVNPACRTEFKLLSNGDLYAFERQSTNTEFFWICSSCASQFDLCLDASGLVSLRPRAFRGTARPPHPDGDLRLVSFAVRRMSWLQTTPAGERVAVAIPDEWVPSHTWRGFDPVLPRR